MTDDVHLIPEHNPLTLQAVKELKTKHGIENLDIVIANAAVNLTGCEFKDLDLDVWETTMNVNVSAQLPTKTNSGICLTSLTQIRSAGRWCSSKRHTRSSLRKVVNSSSSLADLVLLEGNIDEEKVCMGNQR